jgi:hypothetical protein
MKRLRITSRQVALLVALVAIFALPAAAAAAPLAHRVAVSADGFWTPARVQQALKTDSMEHVRVSEAQASSGANLPVPEPSSTTNRTNGLILGVDPRFGLYGCSGTSLATPSGLMVLTAGHCVFEEGTYAKRIVFIPAYNHKERPFGTFKVEAVYTPPPWTRSENSDFDVAVMEVIPTSLGTLTTAVGAKGWTSSRSRFSELQIFGYPGAAFHSEEMRTCVTQGSGSDKLVNYLYGPPTLSADCNMASGSSGGGWLVDGGTLLDGVTSYHYPPNHVTHYSPYFGPQIDNFLRSLP